MIWKDEEFKEARDERDSLRAENEWLRKQHKVEKIQRQSLGADKQKQTMLKELLDNAGPI